MTTISMDSFWIYMSGSKILFIHNLGVLAINIHTYNIVYIIKQRFDWPKFGFESSSK